MKRCIVNLRFAVVFVVCSTLAGCLTTAGVGELDAYRTAFDKAFGTATAILDQLAVQERAVFLRQYGVRTDADATFDPNLATYYTDAADPPGTAAFRRALESVKTYNDLLFGLSSGRDARELAGLFQALGTSLTAAAGEVGGLVGVAAPIGARLVPVSNALSTFLGFALEQRSRREFRRFAIEFYPTVRAVLVALRDGTAVMFPILAADILRTARARPVGTLTAEEVRGIQGYQVILADWVVLLDATIGALDGLKIAVEAEPTLRAQITGLAAIAVSLETTTQTARRHLAELAIQ